MAQEISSQPEPTAEERYAPKLPKQIQAQVDAVNAALAIPEEEPGSEPSPEGAEPGAQPAAPPQPAGQQPPLQPEPSPAGEDTWEQRARSTAGRLDQALNANQQLSRRISELEQQMAMRPVAAPAPPAPRARLVKPEEVNEYGDEFMDVVGRRSRDEFMPELDQLGERLKRLEAGQQGLGSVIATTQKRTVYDELYDRVPEWKQINHHPTFHTWLAFPDPYSGMPRSQLLKDAFARHDANRVVAFFEGFLAEASGPPQEEPSSPGTAAPPLDHPVANGNGQGSGRPSLEDFAAPGRARSVPPQLPPDKPVYTQAQIARFSDEKRRGFWKGREAEVEAIERDIFQAQHEGRIQP